MEKGAHEQSLLIARNFLQNGATPEMVAKCTGLSPEVIRRMQEDAAS